MRSALPFAEQPETLQGGDALDQGGPGQVGRREQVPPGGRTLTSEQTEELAVAHVTGSGARVHAHSPGRVFFGMR